MPDSNDRADILIVGGGSAGAVLAARLTEDSARTVLLLEAGPAYGLDEIPEGVLGAAYVADHDHDWGYTSWGNHDQRTVPAPRGKVLGGSSSVNASVAIRPRPSDLAKWASHGAGGWSYEEVLPAFRDLENTPSGEDHYHGRSGPLPIRQRTLEGLTPGLRGFAPENLQMIPAVGVVLWTPSASAVPGELDLNVTATHLLPGSQSPTGGAIVMGLSVTLPESTGTLKLASADPKDAPLIDSNYLGTGRDARRAVEAFKIGRTISR